MKHPIFAVDDKVSFHHNDGETDPRWYKYGTTFEGSRGTNFGVIVKINRSRARVRTNDGVMWVVYYNCLHKQSSE